VNKADLSPFAEKLYQGFLVIMTNEVVPDSVNENAAIALGRVGIGCSEQLAPHLGQFAEPFLRSLAKVHFTREKASSFLGFNQVVMKSPQAMEACLGDYFHAIATFPTKSMNMEEYRDVQQSFQQVRQYLSKFG
jgi:transportin-1